MLEAGNLREWNMSKGIVARRGATFNEADQEKQGWIMKTSTAMPKVGLWPCGFWRAGNVVNRNVT